MLQRLKQWAMVIAVSALSACGGGGSAGSSPFDTGGDSSVADIRLTLSDSVISTATQGSVTATAVAVNSSNVVVSGATINFTADSGNVTATSTQSDSSGSVSAQVSVGSDTSPRTITVTAVSNGITKQAQFQVVNGSSQGTPTLVPSLSSTSVTSLAPPTVTVTLKDALGQGIANTVVSLSTVGSLGTLSPATVLTGSDGTAQATLYPISTKASGADYVLASAQVGGNTVSGTVGFSITPTTVSIANWASDLATVSAYGRTNLTATLSGVTAGSPVELTVSSVCLRSGKAIITPTTQTVTSATAAFTYTDAGCGATAATDSVTVSITGTTTTSTLSLGLSSPAVSSLGFVSAVPEVIYLRGSGYPEVSNVTFVVKDENGNPLPGRQVTMSATTLAGGLTLNGGTADVLQTSDTNGNVTVRVNAGTVPTPVRIKASLVGTTIQTVSSNLGVAVGLPSQLNFSLAQQTVNIEGGTHDGTTNTYTILAADRMGNPVPNGTTVNFVVEGGGQIEGVKQTALSITNIASTTANFVSQEPRPADHRITVVAYALGEESFLDANTAHQPADNIYNSTVNPDTGRLEYFQDLGDIFLSRRFNNTYDSSVDQVITRALNGGSACASIVGSPSDPSSVSGALLLATNRAIPSIPNTCDGKWSTNKEYVRRATETVLSNSAPMFYWASAGGGTVVGNTIDNTGAVVCPYVTLPIASDGTTDRFVSALGSAVYGLPGSGGMTFLVADDNINRLNPMPAGTQVSVSASDGIIVSVLGGTPIPNTSEASPASISFKFDTATSGTINVKTTTPLGLTVAHPFFVTTASRPVGSVVCSL